MRPYYDENGIKIYHADCREVLPQLARAEVVLTSPPYNMRTRARNGVYAEREKAEHFCKKYMHFHDAYPIDEYYRIHKYLLSEYLRLAPIAFVNIQIVTGSKEAWFRLFGDYAKYIKDLAIWDKGEGQPAMHDAVMNRAHELILILESGATIGRTFSKSYFARGTMPDMWRFGRGRHGGQDGHGAVFPTQLVARILLGWSAAGDTVLDPFMGRGTTLRVAKDLGRKAIGIEIEERDCEIAVQRLTQEVFSFE